MCMCLIFNYSMYYYFDVRLVFIKEKLGMMQVICKLFQH